MKRTLSLTEALIAIRDFEPPQGMTSHEAYSSLQVIAEAALQSVAVDPSDPLELFTSRGDQ